MVPQVRAVALTSYREVASQLGLDSDEMLRKVHLMPEMIGDPESRIPAKSLCKLLEESARASNCETFGLAMAECRTFASLGPVSLLLEHLGSGREVVDAVTEFRRHLNDVIILGVEQELGDDIVRVELLAEYATLQTADLAIGVAYIALRGASRFRWQPFEIHLSHPAPEDKARFNRFFGAPVRFDSVFNGFTCSPAAMQAEWPWANETMASHARRLLRLVPIVPPALPVSESVMRVIILSLPARRATVTHVAKCLGQSARSLQRKLAQENRGFAQLLNEVRRSLAIEHLVPDHCSLTSVSEMLGFSSSSSFTRWFVHEFGVAPSVWRAEQIRAAALNVI